MPVRLSFEFYEVTHFETKENVCKSIILVSAAWKYGFSVSTL